ncbi:hypothetical protein ES708_09248 [subsurface metagenome]
MDYSEIIGLLESQANPATAAGMARYGITAQKVYGITIPVLRKMAKECGRDHDLAVRLWAVNSRETRILASMIDQPAMVDESQMEKWVKDFDSWEVCDQCIMNLFEKTPYAWGKAVEWCSREEEFVKRAGFVLMARLAVSDKKAGDERFTPFFTLIEREAHDSRNFVKKAVNWALRQIGKRNISLNKPAVETAQTISGMESASARWIASDALKELTSDKIRERLS